MTLDQSLANLEMQADRLANLFASTADAIEKRTGYAAIAVADGFATRMPRDTPFHGEGQAAPLDWQPTPPEKIEELSQARNAAIADIAAQAQVPEVIYNPETGEHRHWAMAQPETPQGAAPSSATPPVAPAASAVEVEGPGAGTPATPHPAGPAPEAPPWEGATTAAEPEKKGGRRSNEEIAREVGVDLAAVKAWKGGGRVSKADMEEYKLRNPEAVAAWAAAQAPAAAPAAAPQQAPMPTQASDPMGAPQNWAPAPDGAGAQVAAGQGAAQEWPAAGQTMDEAANPVQAQEMPYTDWPAADAGEVQGAPAAAEWKPF